MISHRHKLIFIHIPKCAGTSIEDALGHFELYSGRGAQDHRTIRHIQPIGLNALANVENRSILRQRIALRRGRLPQVNPNNKLTVTAKQYREYFKFAVVRDPWSRIHSWWRNVMRDETHLRKHGGHIEFEDFLERYAARKPMLAPISYYISDFSGNIPLDRILDFDHLLDQCSELSSELSLPILNKLPHRLKSTNPCNGLRNDFTDKAKQIIASRYADEIKAFGFQFQE